ncbi:MAG: hypothetical protein JNL70_25155 [Saprospiraceae bacterium]|nr:hypothetical protein [Saprospiraceae bacterium]
MQLYIRGATAGRGQSFHGSSIAYFDTYIQEQLDSNGFQSNFEDVWITLAYPPTYILKNVERLVQTYKEWYEEFRFPYSRLNRRFKNVHITLKAPEFSMCFGAVRDDMGFEIIDLVIEDEYQNFTKIDFANILIDKLLIVGELINAKLKEGDIFDFEQYKTILFGIKENITDDFIDSVMLEQASKNHRKENI